MRTGGGVKNFWAGGRVTDLGLLLWEGFSTPLHAMPLTFADVCIFCKKSAFFAQNSTFTQSNSVRAVLEFFSSVFSFCKIKGYY